LHGQNTTAKNGFGPFPFICIDMKMIVLKAKASYGCEVCSGSIE
tara:strand:- start:620 stop:751 length:132 start_codon:yes stop_codon:yes gene_type:complete